MNPPIVTLTLFEELARYITRREEGGTMDSVANLDGLGTGTMCFAAENGFHMDWTTRIIIDRLFES